MARIVLGIFFVAVLAALVYVYAPGISPSELRVFINSFGVLAPVIFITVCAFKPVLFFLPSLGLTVIAGTMFGPLYGTIYVAIGGAGSAAVAFYFARIFGRGAVEKIITKKKTLLSIDEKMERDGFKTVLMLRLFNIPWDLVSYSAGLSRMGFRDFYLSSLIMLLPISFIYTYFGSQIEKPLSPGFIISLCVIIALGSIPFILKRLRNGR